MIKDYIDYIGPVHFPEPELQYLDLYVHVLNLFWLSRGHYIKTPWFALRDNNAGYLNLPKSWLVI